MDHRRIFLSISFWIAVILSGRPVLAEGSFGPPVRLTIIGTADFHGALEARHAQVLGGREVGGIDVIAAYIEALRKADPSGLVLLDAGDMYQGTLLAGATEGQTVVEFYNDLKVDAVAIGNHDFDYGPIGYHSIAFEQNEDPLGVIKRRIDQARFPFLAANLVDRRSGRPLGWNNLKPYTILERKGIKIGVIGLSSIDTPLTTQPANLLDLAFEPLLKTVKEMLPRVRAEGATVIILLAHSGVVVDEETGEFHGPIAELARSLSPSEVDLIVAGHEHLPFGSRINGIPVLQTWPNGIAFARADLAVDRRTGSVIPDQVVLYENTFFFRSDWEGRPSVFAGQIIRPDPRFQQKLEKYRKTISHLQRIYLGCAAGEINHRGKADSDVGNLVTDAMRAADPEIAVAMFNAGGLRNSIPKGDVTFGHIYEVVPFDNFLIKITLKGREIREIIEHGTLARHGLMQVSGLRIEYDSKGPSGHRCKAIQLEDGRPLNPDQDYVVGINEFMLHGGDGYLVFTRGRNVINTHLLIRELLANHVKKLGTLKPGRRGRYVDRNPTGKAGLGL